MHYFHVLWVSSCKAIWELQTSPLLYMWNRGWQPLQLCHQQGDIASKQPCWRQPKWGQPCHHAKGMLMLVHLVGLFRSVWMDQQQFTQGCSGHVLPQKFNPCWPCRAKANLAHQQWTRTKRTISFARGFLEPRCFRWIFLSKEIAPRRFAMCSCKFYT